MVRVLLISAAAVAQLSFAQLPATVARAGGLTGRVVDSSGPVPGATVTARTPGSAQPHAKVTTDASGTYRFERLASGAYMIQAEAYFFYASRREVLVVAGTTTNESDLRMIGRRLCECVHYTEEEKREMARRLGVVRGRVTDRNGRPLPFASVSIAGLEPRRIETNWNGEFALVAAAGALSAHIEYAGARPVERSGLTVTGGEVTQLLVRLDIERTDRDSGEFDDPLTGCAPSWLPFRGLACG